MILAAIALSLAGQLAGCPPEAQPEWGAASSLQKREMLRRCPKVVRPLEPLAFGGMRSSQAIREDMRLLNASRPDVAWLAMLGIAGVATTGFGTAVLGLDGFTGFSDEGFTSFGAPRTHTAFGVGLVVGGGLMVAVSIAVGCVLAALGDRLQVRLDALKAELSVAKTLEEQQPESLAPRPAPPPLYLAFNVLRF